jgi:hypothetical protein
MTFRRLQSISRIQCLQRFILNKHRAMDNAQNRVSYIYIYIYIYIWHKPTDFLPMVNNTHNHWVTLTITGSHSLCVPSGIPNDSWTQCFGTCICFRLQERGRRHVLCWLPQKEQASPQWKMEADPVPQTLLSSYLEFHKVQTPNDSKWKISLGTVFCKIMQVIKF